MAEAYFKVTKKKLKFSVVQGESLYDYKTSSRQKRDDNEFTLMKDNYCYIEDIMKKKFAKRKYSINLQNDQNKDNENEMLNKDKDDLGKNLIEFGDKNENYNFNLDTDKNPFTKVLIGGGVAAGAGIGVAGGSIAACIAFDSVFLASTAGEIFAAGFGFLGGVAFTGIGLVIVIPSLLGFGIYKIYKSYKDKKRKSFFENFDKDIMKNERKFQSDVISKIDRYFNKRIILEPEKEKEINEYINSIIDLYIDIDNKRLQPKIDSKEKDLLKKINNDSKIIIKNISKIRQELMMIILSSTKKEPKETFDDGILLFKEFIKNFGPLHIDEADEKNIDMKIDNIIQIMKEVLEKKMDIAFQKFDLKTFKTSFDIQLQTLYEEKLKLDSNYTKSDLDYNCINFIIEPIGENSKNYGVLSLFFKFTLMIQNIAAKKRQQNFFKNTQKILLALNKVNFNMSKIDYTPMINNDLNTNDNQNKPIEITFIIKENDNTKSKYTIQAFDDSTVEELIQGFKNKMFDENFEDSKFLIDDKTPIDITSKEKLGEKGINANTQIIVYLKNN